MKILRSALFAIPLARLACAQPAIVTAQLETNRIPAGASTKLHIFAQIAPQYRGGYARIFSWNVDALLSNSALATFNPASLIRPTSDNDPQTSSPGTMDGPNIQGIRDSFLNSPSAGRDAPIELFSVEVHALSAGLITLAVQAGSLSDEPDFVVDPIGDGPTLIGGDYQPAKAQLEILAPLTNFVANISQTLLPANAGRLITISFATNSAYSYSVEYTTNLPNWQALPNAPHNDGFADDTNAAPARFYRIRAD